MSINLSLLNSAPAEAINLIAEFAGSENVKTAAKNEVEMLDRVAQLMERHKAKLADYEYYTQKSMEHRDLARDFRAKSDQLEVQLNSRFDSNNTPAENRSIFRDLNQQLQANLSKVAIHAEKYEKARARSLKAIDKAEAALAAALELSARI
ncbi:MAG: hypothetical protein PVI40_05170 [Chlamydiota bacterium]